MRTALIFLSFDEMEERDRPPKRIWLDGDKLREHMDMVKRRRKEEAERGGRDSSLDEIEDPVENAAAKGLIVGG